MKFSLNWLRELVPFTWSVGELAERLTMAGVEVEGIQVQGEGFQKVLVAQILKSEKHPNADRLSVCEVEAGSGRKQIVCGASNYKVGDKVPLALPGTKLPHGLEIKRSKIRGVESDGMMCSPKELGLADDTQGLLILPSDSKVGASLAQALGLDDILFELEITPNRPDLLSHWGLARDIAALGDLPPPNPHQLLSAEVEKRLNESASGSSTISVHVEDPVRCPRYTARVIRGVKVGPSPDWLRRRLESLGQRAISNIVDITNYVLLEVGQPLHAFDLKLLGGSQIIVRLARGGEKIIRLDDITSELRSEMLVIADGQRPVALAGVIGGKETAVTAGTTDILLESATFQPSNIRKTSKTLGVSTDSSYRFERGVDIELAAWASNRALSLILQHGGGQVEGALIDARAQPKGVRKILCRYPRVNSLLGVSVSREETECILKRLGCSITRSGVKSERLEIGEQGTGSPELSSFEVQPPSYRPDLEREADLIEEIGRLHGIEHIPGRMAPAAFSTTHDSAPFLFDRKVRALATAQGFDEAQTYTVIASSDLLLTHPETSFKPLILANPLSARMDTLRCSLLTGLLRVAAHNHGAGQSSLALFELGKIFKTANGKVEEHPTLGILLTGTRVEGALWERAGGKEPSEGRAVEGKAYDFHDLKGVLDQLLGELVGSRVSSCLSSAIETPGLEPGLSFLITLQDRAIGFMGRVARRVAHELRLPGEVFYAEADCEQLLPLQDGRVTRYRPWPTHPSIRRDLALTVDASEKHQRIEQTLRRLAGENPKKDQICLQRIELFDIFLSDNLGAGKKSLAYRLIYQGVEKTLTDGEVNEVHDLIKKKLKIEIACDIRE